MKKLIIKRVDRKGDFDFDQDVTEVLAMFYVVTWVVT